MCRPAAHLFERLAGRERACYVDGAAAQLDGADLAFLIDDEGCAVGIAPLFVQHAVGARDLALEVAEKREGHTVLPGKFLLRREGINADAQNLGIRLPELGKAVPVVLNFARSPSGEGENIESQDNILFSPKIRQLDFVSVLIRQREVRSHIADFQSAGLAWRRLLCTGRNESRCQGQEESRRNAKAIHPKLLMEIVEGESIRQARASQSKFGDGDSHRERVACHPILWYITDIQL